MDASLEFSPLDGLFPHRFQIPFDLSSGTLFFPVSVWRVTYRRFFLKSAAIFFVFFLDSACFILFFFL